MEQAVTLTTMAESYQMKPETLRSWVDEWLKEYHYSPRAVYISADDRDQISAQGMEIIAYLHLKKTHPKTVKEYKEMKEARDKLLHEIEGLQEKLSYYLNYTVSLEKQVLAKKEKQIQKPYEPDLI